MLGADKAPVLTDVGIVLVLRLEVLISVGTFAPVDVINPLAMGPRALEPTPDRSADVAPAPVRPGTTISPASELAPVVSASGKILTSSLESSPTPGTTDRALPKISPTGVALRMPAVPPEMRAPRSGSWPLSAAPSPPAVATEAMRERLPSAPRPGINEAAIGSAVPTILPRVVTSLL